jgi:hypothetical protein
VKPDDTFYFMPALLLEKSGTMQDFWSQPSGEDDVEDGIMMMMMSWRGM